MSENQKPGDSHGPIPYLMLDNAAEALALYEKAFGAPTVSRINYPNDPNKLMHACIILNNGPVFISDTNPQRGCSTPTNSSFYVVVPDVDAAFATAKKAGLEEKSAPQDMFWGDRVGMLKDKFGITWSLAQHKKKLSLDEIKQAAAKQVNQAA